MSKYATNEKAHQLFYDYVRFIIGRTNRYTNVKYVDDPAIMSWQIGNEPRAFSTDALPAFEKWLAEASALIRSLDKNHLISVGSEGAWGCEMSYDSWERLTTATSTSGLTTGDGQRPTHSLRTCRVPATIRRSTLTSTSPFATS